MPILRCCFAAPSTTPDGLPKKLDHRPNVVAHPPLDRNVRKAAEYDFSLNSWAHQKFAVTGSTNLSADCASMSQRLLGNVQDVG